MVAPVLHFFLWQQVIIPFRSKRLQLFALLLFLGSPVLFDLSGRIVEAFLLPYSLPLRTHRNLFTGPPAKIFTIICDHSPTTTTTTTASATITRTAVLLHLLTTTDDVHSNENNVVQRLELTQQFNRWRFLQELLEGDVHYGDVNELLYNVLNAYLHSDPSQRDEGSPILTESIRTTLKQLLLIKDTKEFTSDSCIPIFCPGCVVPSSADDYDGHTRTLLLVSQLESLLPDPIEEKDAHDGLWDTIEGLHGWEGVRMNRQNPCKDWEVRCTVARVLIWFDFLAEGVLSRRTVDPS